MYDDEPRDHGYDLPDKREVWALKDGSYLELWIHRQTVSDPEDPENYNYKCIFLLYKREEGSSRKSLLMQFPDHVREEDACQITRLMYKNQINKKRTKQKREQEAERAHQLKYGY